MFCFLLLCVCVYLKCLTRLRRRSEAIVLDDWDVFIIVEPLVWPMEDGSRPRSGALVLGRATFVVPPLNILILLIYC